MSINLKKHKSIIKLLLFTVIGYLMFSSFVSLSPDWGFYGHRKINRMAVFTLPPDLIPFYKKNIDYITVHAVDPDKRRYASKHEAVRHYIDIDAWGDNPFYDVPRILDDAIIKYASYHLIDNGDTTQINLEYDRDTIIVTNSETTYECPTDTFRQFFRSHVMTQYYNDEDWIVPSLSIDSLFSGFSGGSNLLVVDSFTKEGILPYHLNSMYYRLVKAFKDQDLDNVLRLSAEFGHYIGDAHVPLHTTKNYNGQLTDQVGIHAFWESRLPELYADSEYSFLVGKAEKIDKPLTYFWKIVKESHDLLEDVLDIEKELTQTYPDDQQLCYDERLDRTIRTQCPEFARAYHERLNGMVEARMQDAIHAIGSVWFSAWVDAGQPKLEKPEKLIIKTEEIIRDANISTRDHSY